GELTGIECASGFINSQEYQNLGLSNSDYVKNMYRAFMGREYDEAGYKDWVSKLNAGYTRDEIFAGFANSNEFQSICDSYGIIRGNYVATNVHDENSLREITEVEVEQEEQPATQPTQQPSEQPATQPSQQPSAQPTHQPSSQPTSQPTAGGACNHAYPSAPFSVTEATCESARQEIYQCTKCGAPLYKTVGQPLGHQMKHTEHEDADCISGGYDFYECSRAGCTHYERVDIPALGHNMALDRTIAGTCMTTRTDVYKCKRCGEEERRDGAKGTHVLSDEGYAATCINDGRKAQYCDVCRQFITDEVIPAKGHHAVLKTDANGKKYITCEDCGIEFRYSTQLGTEDTWRALNSNHVLYLQQGHGGRAGFGKIVASVAGKTWDELYEEDYNQYEKIQADFWKRVKIEIGDETVVSRSSQNGSFTYDGKNESYITSGLCNGIKCGTTTVKVYWDDVLYDSFTVKVGGNLVEAVKEYYNNPNPDESVLNGFDSAGRDAVANIVKMLKSTITDDMTDYQKVAAIKNWYDAKITYDSNRDDTAPYFNVFLNKRGICHDYAVTFSMLMDVLDIECYYIKGPSYKGQTGDYHAWNMVRLDAGNGKGLQWYYVDTTWHEFDTTYTVQELNARDGSGRYNTSNGSGAYRISKFYRKYQPEEYSGDGITLAQLQNEGEGFTGFSSFPY
ncbi:MAG: DUF4214 domain-containing protein, partial [Lachnospiraceae bacterium]|nr:DUF4214 domain-containing protein [Lachnospiraceae bacterium]